MDGHGSHLTQEFIEYADANKIILLCLPPHSTQWCGLGKGERPSASGIGRWGSCAQNQIFESGKSCCGVVNIKQPGASPDLNAIENCWALVKMKQRKLPQKPATLDNSWEAIEKIWKKEKEAQGRHTEF